MVSDELLTVPVKNCGDTQHPTIAQVPASAGEPAIVGRRVVHLDVDLVLVTGHGSDDPRHRPVGRRHRLLWSRCRSRTCSRTSPERTSSTCPRGCVPVSAGSPRSRASCRRCCIHSRPTARSGSEGDQRCPEGRARRNSEDRLHMLPPSLCSCRKMWQAKAPAVGVTLQSASTTR